MSIEPYYQEDGITLYCGDCREILPMFPEKSFDLCLTDPPYGIDYKPERKYGSHSGKWGKRKPFPAVVGDSEPFEPAIFLLYPKIILWGANHYAGELPSRAGWLVFDKKRGGTISKGFIASDAELAWTNFLGTVKIFEYLWNGLMRDGEIGEHWHTTQKPIALMSWCIGLSETTGTILDPFCGSGTTLVAAKQLGRKAVGIEISEKYCEIAVKRLAQKEMEFVKPKEE